MSDSDTASQSFRRTEKGVYRNVEFRHIPFLVFYAAG